MRKLCRRHLEAYQSLKIGMEVEWIQGERKPICTYSGCRMPAIYDVKILTDGVVAA
jgi:hypothetical protein